jgi:hypothetical protein
MLETLLKSTTTTKPLVLWVIPPFHLALTKTLPHPAQTKRGIAGRNAARSRFMQHVPTVASSLHSCDKSSQGQRLNAILTGYAYETIPNKPIITGKISGPDVMTLEPGSLGALAAGASRLHKR